MVKSSIFTPGFQAFLNEEYTKHGSYIAFMLLVSFLIISLANLIAIELYNPTIADIILSILLSFLSISATLLIKFKEKSFKITISILILMIQALLVLQYSETYLFRIYNSWNKAFPACEIKVWLTIILYFAEDSLFFRLLAVLIQFLITLIKDETYSGPWVYLNYALIAFFLLMTEIQKRKSFFSFYQTSKQLRVFSFLINKVLPFGYIVLGIEDQKPKQTINLLAYNDFMKKIFEIEEKDSAVVEKLLSIFRSNFLNRNKKTLSCLSLDEKKQKSILTYALDKLEISLKKKPFNDEIKVLEEIYQQEVIYKDGKAKAMDIIILQANISTKPCILLVINDISDKVLNYKLTNLDRFKDRFLQSVSHNLKTPLNSITGLVSLIHNLVFHTEVLNYLNNIRINSDILLFGINNILDYANYRKSSLQAIVSEFSITSLLNELFTLFELSLFEKKININRKIKLEPEQNIMFSDFARLKQILFNVLNNAVKFTFEGQISVIVSKPSDLMISTDLLKFSIKDTGIGISSEDQLKLYKLWGSLNDDFIDNPHESHNSRSGAGLGLTISKHLIGLLGPEEKIYCKSLPGKGTTFCFYIYQNLNANKIFNTNKRKIEFIPSYDSSNISFNRMTINSQYMLNSIHKNDTMGFANFSSYITQNIKSPKRNSIIMRNSFNKGFLYGRKEPGFSPLNYGRKEPGFFSPLNSNGRKEPGFSPSNFSPKIKKNSLPPEIFNEGDCIVNKVYYNDDMKKIGEINLMTGQLMERSSFSFKINLINIDRSTTKEIINTASLVSPINHKKILIVDDTPFNLLVLEKFIQEIDPKALLFKAFNGKEAVELFINMKETGKSGIDLIFMDCNMPVMDGYEASLEIKKIIKEEKLNFTPILAVTAYSGKEEEMKCLKNGMDGYLGKPINKEKFHEFYSKWAFQR